MPVWIQITAALSAAFASGIMGIALVPFLKQIRFCEPERPDEQKTQTTREQVKPTMCGLLLAFGILFGMVLSFTLFREFSGTDLTHQDFAEQSQILRLALVHGLLLTIAGFVTDYLTVRRRLRYTIRPLLLTGTVFLITLGLLSRNLSIYQISISVLTAVCWRAVQGTEQETDGVSITVGAVQLLMLTMLLLKEKQHVIALYPLTAAGACMGCMIWNLHPAKCRLGHTGSFLLGSIMPFLCIMEEQWLALALSMSVYLLNYLPLLRKKDGKRLTLLANMTESGMEAWQRIALLAGFSIFCGIVEVII